MPQSLVLSRPSVVADAGADCGYGVPPFDYVGEHAMLTHWAEAKAEEDLETYWQEKNLRSIDGLPTGLLEEVTSV